MFSLFAVPESRSAVERSENEQHVNDEPQDVDDLLRLGRHLSEVLVARIRCSLVYFHSSIQDFWDLRVSLFFFEL